MYSICLYSNNLQANPYKIEFDYGYGAFIYSMTKTPEGKCTIYVISLSKDLQFSDDGYTDYDSFKRIFGHVDIVERIMKM